MSRREGFSLITVVAVIGALSAVVGLGAVQSRIAAVESRANYDQARLRAAIDAAVYRAEAGLSMADEARRWQPDGRPYETEIGGVRLTIHPLAASGRFDLNSGDPDLLAALLGEIGLGLGQANAMAAALKDWRDADDDISPGGAESAAYRNAGLNGPGDRPLLAREEFRDVLGVDAETYAAARLFLTVDSGELQPAFAPPALLRAMDAPSSEAARILGARRSGAPAVNGDGDQAFDPSPGARYALLVEAETEAGAVLAMEIEFASSSEEAPLRVLRRSPLSPGDAAALFEAENQ